MPQNLNKEIFQRILRLVERIGSDLDEHKDEGQGLISASHTYGNEINKIHELIERSDSID